MENENQNLFLNEEDLAGKPSKEDRVLGAICYAHFLFLAPFLLQKDTEFLKFHMKQGGTLYVLYVLILVISSIFFPIDFSLRIIGFLFLGYTGLAIFVGYRAYLGEKYEIGFLKSLVKIVGDKMNEK